MNQKGLQSSDSKSLLQKGHEDKESSNSSSDRNHSSSSGDDGIDREVGQKESKKKKKKRLKHTCISVGCWNVWSLVSNTDRSSSIPRKSELVVQELRRLGIALAGLSETRWLGQGIVDC